MKLRLQKILKDKIVGENTVVGWVRSVRKTKRFSFIILNDGSTSSSLQIIADSDLENYDMISSMLAGTSVEISGILVESQGKNQDIEMQATSINILGQTDDNYPLQKKATSLEFLRSNAHLRSRTTTFGAMFRLRHAMAFATHQFFNERSFCYVNTPIITGIDAEGAGEMFSVTSFDLSKKNLKDLNFKDDYFGKSTNLAVTGQLEAECLALGLGAVYTFGPTFRSENSNTPRHLSEFWMIEPEVAFADLNDIIDLAADYIKYLINYALENSLEDLKVLLKFNDSEDHIDELCQVRDNTFKKITYSEAISILEESGQNFEFKTEWGSELQTEHERYLTDTYFKSPVAVTDYPKSCKAFYMKQNDDNKTVRAMDMLVPGVGEIIGGSQREDSLEKLESRINELGMDSEALWWYRDLRRFGTVPHAGFGLGFERVLMYISKMKNIRDVIPFPRTPQNAEF